ncbi:MAG: lipopolysaccharide heptosyltransferase II [Pseudomonadota bacterium]
MSGERLLVVGPAWVGDMVMADSFFQLLKERDPLAHLCVLAPPATAGLLPFMPSVDQSEVLHSKSGRLDLAARWRLGRRLSKQGFQRALILPRSIKAALVPAFARVPQRVGYAGDPRWGLVNDLRPFDRKAVPRSVDRFLALALPQGEPIPAAPEPRLMVSEAVRTESLTKAGLTAPQAPLLALCPGAAYGPAKRWPAEHFAAVARHWTSKGGLVWVFGQAQDRQAAEIIRQTAPAQVVDLTGRTDLAGALGLMTFATAAVCNDSGLMHVAAALAKPLVALYGSSTAEETPPLSAKAQVLGLDLECRPCHQRTCPLGHLRCLQDLAPDRVIEALRSAQVDF